MSNEKDDLRMQFAAGETEQMPPKPPAENDVVKKDTNYIPASETETSEKQQGNVVPDSVDDEIDKDAVRAVPGTGGPDDTGDVDVDPEDLNLPWRDDSR